MVDPKYNEISKIRKVIKRSACMGRAIIIINILAIIIFPIYAMMIFKYETRKLWSPFALSFFISVFMINFLTLCHYYRMSEFYLKIMSKNYKKEKTKFKVIITIYILFLIISNIKENLWEYAIELYKLITKTD